MKTILGIDPGFAKCGIAIVELMPDAERVISLFVACTSKSDKKRKVRASEDNVRRAAELFGMINFPIGGDTIAICAEAQSWPRNAGAIAKIGIAWGVVAGIAARHGLPVLQATPKELKRAVCGRGTASKKEVQAALVERYGELPLPPQRGLHEHACDALAAVVACLDADVIKLARRML